MRDARITLFSGAPLIINTNVTTNGDTIDLKDGYTGNYFEGAPRGHGLGVELLFYNVTGTRIDIAAKWQVSDDGSTWVDDQAIVDDANLMTLTTNSPSSAKKYAVPTRLVTSRRYARIVVTTTDVAGAGQFYLNAWVSDGTTEFGKATQPRI